MSNEIVTIDWLSEDNKKIIKNRKFDNRVRHIFWLIFLILSFSSGYLVFETINVVGILSRFIAYGWSLALCWVIAIFLIEVFFSRRAWCTYICPIGTTYGYIGKISAFRIQWNDNSLAWKTLGLFFLCLS